MSEKSDPLASALQRLLTRQQEGGVFEDGPYWTGNIRKLFCDLIVDGDEYHRVVDRPHDAPGLRKVLKKRAIDLHRVHGIVVGLAGKTVTLKRATK